MLGTMIGWIKSLFDGKGTTQVGKDQQAATGTTSGSNTPVVIAGRDVHMAPEVPDPDDELLSDLEETMPELLDRLRKALA